MTPAAAPADFHFVALQGFSEFERGALASFFRLAQRGSHAFRQLDDPRRADFLIADADQPAAVAAIRAAGRMADAVFVGARAPAGAAAWLPRPIEPVRIVRALDALVALRRSAPTMRIEIGTASSIETLPADGVDLLLHDLELPAQDASAASAHAAPAASNAGAGREVLVADDSAVARKFLMLRLQRLGYRVHLAHDGEQAAAMLKQRSFSMVFLDITLGPPGSIDGLQLCQHIKQRKPGPAVLLVTGLASSTDRVRGSLAGCDAYLTKPLMEAEFIAALCEVDPAFKQARDAATA